MAVGAAVRDRRLVGGDRAVGSVRGAVAAHGVSPARARGAAGARAARGMGVVAAGVARFGLRRRAGSPRRSGDRLRARAGAAADRDDAESRSVELDYLVYLIGCSETHRP